MRLTLPALCLVGLAGCTDDAAFTSLEGVYTISTWTQNPQACDVEGPSVAASRDPLLYLKAESFFGTDFVNVVPCPDQAACTTQARDGDTIHLGDFIFETGSDKAGWTGRSSGSFGSAGQCNGFVSDVTLTATGQTIRIEQRTTESAPFTGECTIEAAEAAAVGQPCSELEVLTATFTAAF